MAQLLCPYCFTRFSSGTLVFRCVNNDGTLCPPEDDQNLWRYRRMATQKEHRVFSVKNGWRKTPTEVACTACGVRTTKRVCPDCHNALPSQFGELDTVTVAMIGAKASGKSNFIGVLVHELRNRVGDLFDASLNSQDEQTDPLYHRYFAQYIFGNHMVVPATAAAGGYELRYPLVYKFVVPSRRFGRGVRRGIMLVFFDTAGETLDSIDTMSTEARYILNADGLIFLLDPLQIHGVRNQLSESANLPQIFTSPDQIVNRTGRLIRDVTGRAPEIPVAIAFSKIDAIRPLVDQSSPVHRASMHDGYYDESDGAEMHESMRGYLHEWTGGAFERTVRDHFKQDFRYFGVSALGGSPDVSGRLVRGIAPFRVEDPFLWLMKKFDIVPAEKEKQ